MAPCVWQPTALKPVVPVLRDRCLCVYIYNHVGWADCLNWNKDCYYYYYYYGTRSQGISQFYLDIPRTSATGMNHTCLFLPRPRWSSFTDPEGIEGWVGLSRLKCSKYLYKYSSKSNQRFASYVDYKTVTVVAAWPSPLIQWPWKFNQFFRRLWFTCVWSFRGHSRKK